MKSETKFSLGGNPIFHRDKNPSKVFSKPHSGKSKSSIAKTLLAQIFENTGWFLLLGPSSKVLSMELVPPHKEK